MSDYNFRYNVVAIFMSIIKYLRGSKYSRRSLMSELKPHWIRNIILFLSSQAVSMLGSSIV